MFKPFSFYVLLCSRIVFLTRFAEQQHGVQNGIVSKLVFELQFSNVLLCVLFLILFTSNEWISLKIGRFSQKVRQIIRHPRQLIWKNSVAIQDKLKSRIVVYLMSVSSNNFTKKKTRDLLRFEIDPHDPQTFQCATALSTQFGKIFFEGKQVFLRQNTFESLCTQEYSVIIQNYL